jgi:hypothetical protein
MDGKRDLALRWAAAISEMKSKRPRMGPPSVHLQVKDHGVLDQHVRASF